MPASGAPMSTLPSSCEYPDQISHDKTLRPTAASQRRLLPTRPPHSQASHQRPLRQSVSPKPSKKLQRLLDKRPCLQSQPATPAARDSQIQEEIDHPNGHRSYGASPTSIWRAEAYDELVRSRTPQPLGNEHQTILNYVRHRREVNMGLVPDDEDTSAVNESIEHPDGAAPRPDLALRQVEEPEIDFSGIVSIEDVRNRYIEFTKQELAHHELLLHNLSIEEFRFITGMSGRHRDSWARALTKSVLYLGKIMLARRACGSRRLRSQEETRKNNPGPTPLRECTYADPDTSEDTTESDDARVARKRKRETDPDASEPEELLCQRPPKERRCMSPRTVPQDAHFADACEESEILLLSPAPLPSCNDMSTDQLIDRFYDLVSEQDIDIQAVMGLNPDEPLKAISPLRYQATSSPARHTAPAPLDVCDEAIGNAPRDDRLNASSGATTRGCPSFT